MTDQYLANFTTDGGTFHVFDIRTDKRRAAIVSDLQKKVNKWFIYNYKYKSYSLARKKFY